jgi:hypothetical protein
MQLLVMTRKNTALILDAAETVLLFGFDRSIYGSEKMEWLQELKQEREKDIRIMTMEK